MQYVKPINISNDSGTSRSHGVRSNGGIDSFVREEALAEQEANTEYRIQKPEAQPEGGMSVITEKPAIGRAKQIRRRQDL